MENDSIRASGNDTLVDIWVNGKIRAICITKEAIEGFIGSIRETEMSDEDRCEFVRTHLPLVVAAVKIELGKTDSDADTVVIRAGQIRRPAGSTEERRKAERRKGERRKQNLPTESLPHGERRRGNRRKGERRGR